MIYVIGDLHANEQKLQQIITHLAPGDTVIVLGDWGIGFWNSRSYENELYNKLESLPFHFLFVDGNHENFQLLNQYPIEIWCGGNVHVIRKNILHLIRGEVFQIAGMTVFVFGGANSFDRQYRVEGFSWWPEEMPSTEDYKNAEQNLNRIYFEVDYILTHSAPTETVKYLSTSSDEIDGERTEELPLTNYLDTVCQRVHYRHWYFGHFHLDRSLWRSQTVLFDELLPLGDSLP